MEYVEKLIGNISLVYTNENVKVIVKDNDGNVIEVINSSINGFRDRFKLVVLSYLNELLNNGDVRGRRIKKLINNIDEVVDILLTKSALILANNTDIFKDDIIDCEELIARRIGKVLFRTDLNVPSIRDITDKMEILQNIENDYSNGYISSSFYQEALCRCNSEIELMYCARGEADFQFDDDLIVRISQDIMNDYESYKCFMKIASNRNKKTLKRKKFGFFGK